MIKEAKNIQEKPAQPVVTEKIIQQEDTIDLLELFWVLVNHWKIILLTMLITAMLAGVYYLVGVKPSYQADASIFITNNESVITVSDLQLSSELTEDYAKIIKSRNVLKQVIKELDLDLDYMKEPEALAAEHFEGKILGHVTNFYGICPDCLKKDTM